jgi:clan AA aspartic protease
MGTFKVDIEIGDPQGEHFERVEALVDTGATYAVLPRSLLQRLNVPRGENVTFRIADGGVVEHPIGQTWIRLDGRSHITIVVFGPEDAPPILGAYALEGFRLAADPVSKRLVPVEGLLMTEACELR